MKIKKFGSAAWVGGIKDGKGEISTESGALSAFPYGFQSRFEGVKGSNPEELIGAAHASCFTMALSLVLTEAKLKAEKLETTAEVTLESDGPGFKISEVKLTLKARIPETTNEAFQKMAMSAKENCPVSKLFNAKITLEATLLK